MGGGGISLGGVRYDLVQFHFHAPAELVIGSDQPPMELHLVHESAKGELAVLGVFLEQGAGNGGYRDVFDNLPAEEGEGEEIDIQELDPAALLPGSLRRFSHDGSLTTPPCTEGVRWTVLAGRVEVSAEQLSAFTDLYRDNARPVQPLNDRRLVEGD